MTDETSSVTLPYVVTIQPCRPPLACFALVLLIVSTFTSDLIIEQMQLYMQILRALKEVNPNYKELIFENCKLRIIICCEVFLIKNTIKKKLRSLLLFEVIFLNNQLVIYI